MEPQNVECQLAQQQMERYLRGEPLPDDVLNGLESHIKSCADCTAFAEEKRVSLEAMVNTRSGEAPVVVETAQKARRRKKKNESVPDIPTEEEQLALADQDPEEEPRVVTHDVESSDEPIFDLYEAPPAPQLDDLPDLDDPAPELAEDDPEEEAEPAQEPAPAQPVREPEPELVGASAQVEAEPAASPRKAIALPLFIKKNVRTLALSGLLGAVLIGMSAFMNRSDSLLGPKADKLVAKKGEAKKEELKDAKPEEPAHEKEPKVRPKRVQLKEHAPETEPEPDAEPKADAHTETKPEPKHAAKKEPVAEATEPEPSPTEKTVVEKPAAPKPKPKPKAKVHRRPEDDLPAAPAHPPTKKVIVASKSGHLIGGAQNPAKRTAAYFRAVGIAPRTVRKVRTPRRVRPKTSSKPNFVKVYDAGGKPVNAKE